MLTFEQAKALTKGDVVYATGYKCYVVKVTLNESEQSAEVVYTDGGSDEFTAGINDPQLSLTRPTR